MNARQLRNEYYETYEHKTAHQKAAFKARITRLAKKTRRDSRDGRILEGLADALGYSPAFLDAVVTVVNPRTEETFEVPLVRVQLVPESAIPNGRQIRSPYDSANLLQERFGLSDRELFIVLHLDTRNKVVSAEVVHQGTLNSSLVSPREVFKGAILANAAAVVVAHNHPSGDPSPSPDDLAVNKNLVSAGKLLDIEVLDHIVFGPDRFISLRERCLGGF